jgi:plastocyanin
MKRTHWPIVSTLALGFLLAASASGQHHAMPGMGKVDYDPTPGGGDPNTPANCQGVQAKVQISGTVTAFSPSTVTIDAGQPVCWTWTGTYDQHNVKADDGSFTSGPPDTRGTFQRTFTTPGTYGFYCQVHGSLTGGMRGTVIVRDGSGGGGEESGPGTIQVNPDAVTVDEAAGTVTVGVERIGGSDGAASVKFATAPGTAKTRKDFGPRKGVLRWANGEEGLKTVDVQIKNDGAVEPDETFSVKLSKATRAKLGNAVTVVTIHDDDGGGGCASALFAPSSLQAAGQSASEIHLAWEDESAAAGVLKIERRQPGGAFREIASVAPGVGSFTDSGLPESAVFQYRIRAEGSEGGVAYSAVAAAGTDGSTASCDDTGKALCLHNGRFEATVEWSSPVAGEGRVAKRLSVPELPNSGLFSAAGADPQLLLNVRDGCALNDRFWLDLAAVSEDEFTVKVRDTQTGRTWVYFHPAGSTPVPVHDSNAFATCP